MAYDKDADNSSLKTPKRVVKKQPLNSDQLRTIRFAELDKEFARQIKRQASFVKTLLQKAVSKDIKPLM